MEDEEYLKLRTRFAEIMLSKGMNLDDGRQGADYIDDSFDSVFDCVLELMQEK